MSQMLRPPMAGPLLGHTTDSSTRVWMRATDVEQLRTVGVAALFDGAAYVPGSARYFRLQREYDRTGIVDFTGLEPDHRYRVRMGSLVTDSTNSELLVDDTDVYSKLPSP